MKILLNKKNLVGYPNDALNSGLDSARAMRVKVSAICAEFAQNISINFIFRQWKYEHITIKVYNTFKIDKLNSKIL